MSKRKEDQDYICTQTTSLAIDVFSVLYGALLLSRFVFHWVLGLFALLRWVMGDGRITSVYLVTS
jgi:hypothetical protein